MSRNNFAPAMMAPAMAFLLVLVAWPVALRGVDAAKTFDLIWIQTEGGPRFRSEVLSMNI